MKKTIIVLALLVALIPAAAFADFQIGVVAGDLNTSINSLKAPNSFSASDLSYGLEARLKLWILQAGVSAFYEPDIETVYIVTDAGLALDIWFLRLGAGVGPIIAADTQGGGSTTVGWNLKTTLDINLGNLGLGVIAYTPMSSLSDIGNVFQNYLDNTYLGVTLMFKLF